MRQNQRKTKIGMNTPRNFGGRQAAAKRRKKRVANWEAIERRAIIAQNVCVQFGVGMADLMRAGPVAIAGNRHARSAAEVPADPYAEKLAAAWLEFTKRCKDAFLITPPKKRTKKQKTEDETLKKEQH